MPKQTLGAKGTRALSRELGTAGGTPSTSTGDKSGRKVTTTGTGNAKPPTAREIALNTITGVEAVAEKLREDGYMVKGMSITTANVSFILMQLTASVVPGTAAILKSVALLVERMGMQEMAENITKVVVKELKGPIRELRERVSEMKEGDKMAMKAARALADEMSEPVEDLKRLRDELRDLQEGLEVRAKEICDETTDLHAEVADIQEKNRLAKIDMEEANEKMQTVVEELKKLNEEGQRKGCKDGVEQLGKARPQVLRYHQVCHGEGIRVAGGGSAGPGTYAEKAKLTLVQKQAIERTAERSSKVLFAPITQGEKQGLEGLKLKVLLAKAVEALEAMRREGIAIPEGIAFKGAKTLLKGDVVYDMSSVEVAVWLRKEDMRRAFLTGFGGMSKIEDEDIPVLIQNVPVEFNIMERSLRELEVGNDLPANSVIGCKWIKPIRQRYRGQRMAYMIAKMRRHEGANMLIRKGVFAEGKKCCTRKPGHEPPRCTSARSWG